MKVVNCKKEPYTVYIGRPSPLGNPFIIGRDGSREQVVIKFKHFAVNNKDILRRILELKTDDILGCFCAPEDCHGYAIKEIWEDLHEKQ
jgi:hypothetical protein